MKERPIIFSAPMVRAILDGKKTQTRRLVGLNTLQRSETPGYDWTWRGQAPIRSIAQQRRYPGGCWQDVTDAGLVALCPYGAVGDRLWVREAFARFSVGEGLDTPVPECVAYRATCDDEGRFEYANTRGELLVLRVTKWTSPIYMPRWASRITLEIADVRVQRLQDMSEDDARAEGVDGPHFGRWNGTDGAIVPAADEPPRPWAHSFAVAWQEVHGDGAWFANPWVWALTFKRVEQSR
jgi:hypothetical protein